MGFIQQMLQNASQQQTTPQQSAQSRFGLSGLMESLRNMTPPSQNLPSNVQGSRSDPSPFGPMSSGILGIIQQLRNQSGQQGLGGQLPRPQSPSTPLVHPVQNSGQVPYGSPSGGGYMPNFPQMPNLPTVKPSTPNFPSWGGSVPSGGGTITPPPYWTGSSAPQVNPQMPRPQIPQVTSDPRPPSTPTQPQQPTQIQSRYSGLSRPTFNRG